MHTLVGRAGLRAYAVLAYAMFLAAAVAALAFLADLADLADFADFADFGGRHVVDGAARGSVWTRAAIDLGLLTLFAVQHSVMARAGFKARLQRVLPAAAERSTYVLATSLALLLIFWQWRALPQTLWQVDAQPWRALIWGVCALGWMIAVTATFMVDHLDFLGLRQAGWRPQPGPYRPPSFTERWLYAWLRHPMMAGLILAFWATPRMTVGHLLFATGTCGYIAVGVRLEERDLYRDLGETYADYADRVPALIPQRPANRGASARRAPRTSPAR